MCWLFKDSVNTSRCVALNYKMAAKNEPIPVAAPPKAWVCGGSLAGIAGLNPAADMDVCHL
jgi:hypothetical protein